MTSVLKYFTTPSLIHCVCTLKTTELFTNSVETRWWCGGNLFFRGGRGAAVTARISILFYQFSSEIKKEKEIILVG